MIHLTRLNGAAVFLNAFQIISVEGKDNGSTILTANNKTYDVIEPPTVVAVRVANAIYPRPIV